MIAGIVIAVIALCALVYVLGPLRRDHERAEITPSPVEDMASRKRAALAALVDLDDERALGKLSEADFEELRARYEAEAVEALKQLDAVETVDTVGDPLEAEIAALRAGMTCPSCGALRRPGGSCEACGI